MAKHLLFRCTLAAFVSLAVFQCVSIVYARRATVRGLKLERELEDFSVGKTTRGEIERRFNHAGMTLQTDGGCSPASCSYLHLIISNYPRFEPSRRIAVDYYLATISVVRPAGISVDFYFTNDRLSRIGIFFGGETGDHIQFTRWHREGRESGEVISDWQKSLNTGTKYIAVSIDEDGDPTYGSLARSFDFSCLSRIGACSATQLWPTAPPPTKEELY